MAIASTDPFDPKAPSLPAESDVRLWAEKVKNWYYAPEETLPQAVWDEYAKAHR